MFEKEAEEWAIDYVYKDCSKYKECKSKEHCTCKDCSKEKWQNGAEFGYNKCKEELNHKGLALQSDMDKTIEQNIALKKELNKANEWHFVKDGDLPKEEGAVLIYWKCGDIKCASVVEPYKVTEDTHIIAWKEIVLPGQEG